MNHTELRDFSSKTLTLISGLIDKRTAKIRDWPQNAAEEEELRNLLEFQTQVGYAKILVLKEEKVLQG